MEQANSISAPVGIILLAAGASSRLGHPKQLLSLNGQSLLQHSLQAALDATAGPVVVVLGANADAIKKSVQWQQVQTVLNQNWQEGMAASIRCGVQHLLKGASEVEAAILMVCDQPFVSSALFKNLISAHRQTGKPIVTCSYADTFGPPTLFQKSLFSELLQLKGDVGARSILRDHANNIASIPFSEGVIDIDTEADYQQVAKDKPPS